jgi:hypothetical protein
MARRLPDGDGFVDDADESQPRVVVTIDGGPPLDDGERALRDFLAKDFIDAAILAIRNFYTMRQQLGPPKRPIDASKLAVAIAAMEAPTE